MILRARHLFFAWLAYGVLQLALLGVGGVGGMRAGINDRGTRPQSATPTVAATERLLAPEPNARRAPLTPFIPASLVRLELPAIAGVEPARRDPSATAFADAVSLPPVRAPPALS